MLNNHNIIFVIVMKKKRFCKFYNYHLKTVVWQTVFFREPLIKQYFLAGLEFKVNGELSTDILNIFNSVFIMVHLS